jgi:hypothetical protein
MAERTDRPHDAADVVMYLLQVWSYCRLQKWGLLNVLVDRSTELTFQVAILLPMRSVSSFYSREDSKHSECLVDRIKSASVRFNAFQQPSGI